MTQAQKNILICLSQTLKDLLIRKGVMPDLSRTWQQRWPVTSPVSMYSFSCLRVQRHDLTSGPKISSLSMSPFLGQSSGNTPWQNLHSGVVRVATKKSGREAVRGKFRFKRYTRKLHLSLSTCKYQIHFHTSTEVKQRRVWLALGWDTSFQVLSVYCL